MFADRGHEPLDYRRIAHRDAGTIAALDLDPEQVERFLDPLDHILAEVRGGPAHSLFAIEAAGEMVGFYVLHPDRRDNACWWLGWLAFDRRQQGRGYGRKVMARIMTAFRRQSRCRRARLLVAPDNVHAMRLYARAGFRRVGANEDGDLIYEAALTAPGVRFRGIPVRRAPRLRPPQRSPEAHAPCHHAIERGPPGRGLHVRLIN